MYSIVYLLKWCERPSLKYAAVCGLFIGLGMMTKVSAALFAVAAAITVIIKFLIDKNLKFNKVLLYALLFVAVLLPLGLWHPIRNFVFFQQPLGYVAPIPITNPLYNGDISLFSFHTHTHNTHSRKWKITLFNRVSFKRLWLIVTTNQKFSLYFESHAF